MKKVLYIGGGSLLLLLALICAAVFASPLLASAHGTATPTTTPTSTKGTTKHVVAKHTAEYLPLRVFTRNHSDALVDQIAPQLHLTAAQLTEKLKNDGRLVKIAKDQGVSLKDLKAILIKSTNTVIDQELHAGKLDQKRATLLKGLVEKHTFIVGAVLHHHFDPKKR